MLRSNRRAPGSRASRASRAPARGSRPRRTLVSAAACADTRVGESCAGILPPTVGEFFTRVYSSCGDLPRSLIPPSLPHCVGTPHHCNDSFLMCVDHFSCEYSYPSCCWCVFLLVVEESSTLISDVYFTITKRVQVMVVEFVHTFASPHELWWSSFTRSPHHGFI